MCVSWQPANWTPHLAIPCVLYLHSCQSVRRASPEHVCMWQEVVQRMGAALSAPSQAMRVATLRLLCCFEQPQLTSGAAPAGTSQTSQVFTTCLTIQTQPFTSDSGRQAAVAIGRLRNQLEYKQVPSQQVVPVVRCLIGIMHIRWACMLIPMHCLLPTQQYGDDLFQDVVATEGVVSTCNGCLSALAESCMICPRLQCGS